VQHSPAPSHNGPVRSVVNGHRTKPTVPIELPPEFHPREMPSDGHTPVSEDAGASFRMASNRLPVHHAQSSVEGLVFGGVAQESPAVPSTPQEFELEAPAPLQTFSRPPPGLAPHLAPPFYPGHSQHPSEPNAPWLHPGYSVAVPPDAIHINGHDYHSTAFPAVSGAFQPPFPTHLSQTAVGATNGATTSHSQSPTKSQFGEAKTRSNHDDEPQSIVYTNGRSPLHGGMLPEAYDIGKHIFNQFGNPEFTDYILNIRSPDAVLFHRPVHAVVVSRSPVIFEALRHSAPPAFTTKDPRRLVDILVDDRFVTSESLHEAITILYAAPLLLPDAFLYGLSPYDGAHDREYAFNEARKRMEQAISYAAAGRALQIPEMHSCGLRIVKALLRWDTLDLVLHLGFLANPASIQSGGIGPDRRMLEAYAMPLLEDALDFIAYNFPSDFALYAIAPELRQTPRLPTLIETKQPVHNPRLSKIRFGDAPLEDELKPSYVTQLLSSIFLSLPIPFLDRLFSHPAAANRVGWSGLVKIMRDVVEERETRRRKAFASHVKPSTDSATSRALLENLYVEEHVEPTADRPSGFKLVVNRPAEHA